MSKSHIELGQKGEQRAVDFLKANGYNIVDLDYRTPLGQIDIIAKDKRTICFIEVKTRKSAGFGRPFEAVGARKQRKISQVALIFLKQNKALRSPARFDVLSIYYAGRQPKIELIKNAFNLSDGYLY
ncbi:MAG: YraN family protein [Candidatus Omnitrophota bacterium]